MSFVSWDCGEKGPFFPPARVICLKHKSGHVTPAPSHLSDLRLNVSFPESPSWPPPCAGVDPLHGSASISHCTIAVWFLGDTDHYVKLSFCFCFSLSTLRRMEVPWRKVRMCLWYWLLAVAETLIWIAEWMKCLSSCRRPLSVHSVPFLWKSIPIYPQDWVSESHIRIILTRIKGWAPSS